MTLFRIALRSHRGGTIFMAVTSALVGLANAIGFIAVAGPTTAERQAFAQQMAILGKQMSYLLPPPLDLDTMGGYLTWRNFSTVALVLTIWGLLAGTGAARGDEERGQTEIWLAAGVSRVRWLATRTAGYVVMIFATVVVTLAVTEAGTVIAGEPLPAGAMALEGIVIVALALVGFGIGLLLGQLVLTRRSAASIGAVVLVALYTLNSAVRSGGDLGALADISPFRLFDRSTPLMPHGSFDTAATLALFGIAALLVAISVAAFARRDLGASTLGLRAERTRPTFRSSRDALLRLPVLAIVDQQRLWIAGWSVALAALGYFLVSIGRTMLDAMNAIPTMRGYFERAGLQGYSDFIGIIWFSTALLVLSALVVIQVNGWASDDQEGRLEAMLAAGASRSRVVVERIAAVLIAVGVAAGVSTVVVALTARAAEITVPADRLVVATVFVLPVAFAFAGLGHLLVGWRPRVAVVVLSIVAVYSYFVVEFVEVFDWPGWVKNTSAFALYGNPMSSYDWAGLATLVAIGVFGTSAALLTMRRRDVGA